MNAALRSGSRANLFAHVSDFTSILQAANVADPKVAEQLLPLVYGELRRLAAAKLAIEQPGQTLQATALVHEAYVRLVGNNREKAWQDRRHFFAAAAEAMRRILVDRARHKAAARHGGGLARLDLDDVSIASTATDENVLRVSDALEKLATRDAEVAELVTLRFFAGFTFTEAADLLGVSERTAMRMWAYGRAWLFREITNAKGR